jgi:hypothetical protein
MESDSRSIHSARGDEPSMRFQHATLTVAHKNKKMAQWTRRRVGSGEEGGHTPAHLTLKPKSTILIFLNSSMSKLSSLISRCTMPESWQYCQQKAASAYATRPMPPRCWTRDCRQLGVPQPNTCVHACALFGYRHATRNIAQRTRADQALIASSRISCTNPDPSSGTAQVRGYNKPRER